MICTICKSGHYKEGYTTVVLTRGDSSVIIKQVPALVCDQCGEYILSSDITKKVMLIAETAYANGAELEIRRFAA